MKAVTVESLGQIVVKDDVAKPSLEDGEVLLKVNAVALNPTDWKHAHYISEPGSLLGCDVMGTVVEAKGDGPLKVGQKVASLVHGGRRPDRGSFAEYARVDSKIAWPVPENVSDEQAAAMAGVGPHTAMQHLFLRHGLPWPGTGSAKDEPFLVWSGATSVGSVTSGSVTNAAPSDKTTWDSMYTIQLAKLIGCRVITTASEKNWDLLKQLGADDCFTYTDPETPNKIRAQYPNLAHALDCIVTGDSTKSCSQALGEKGGYITTLLPPKPEDNAGRDNVKIESALVRL